MRSQLACTNETFSVALVLLKAVNACGKILSKNSVPLIEFTESSATVKENYYIFSSGSSIEITEAKRSPLAISLSKLLKPLL